MTFSKVRSRLWLVLSAVALITVSIILFGVTQCAINPSAYSLSSLNGEIISKVETEFLFTLPEEALISYVTYTKGMGRGEIARCCISGRFTPDEFVNVYVQFNIDSEIEDARGIYKISGFSKKQDDVDATLELTENDGQTIAIIQKMGMRDKTLFDEMTKIN